MEFMFWGCFLYDKKGLCYIWKAETAAEKKEYTQKLAAINKALKPEVKLQWELQTGMRRMGLRNLSGVKPQWRFTAETGKVTIIGKKGGINWYRYQKKVCLYTFLQILRLLSLIRHRFSFHCF